MKPPWTANSDKDACSPGADVGAVVQRRHMLDTLVMRKLLGPWTHDDQLDDAVLRLAASFPLHERLHVDYMIPGDELYPFDPNAFLQRLVEETGVAHTWVPVRVKVAEGGRCYGICFASGTDRDREREARSATRELLRMIWCRFSGFDDMFAPEETRAHLSSVLFEDYLIANTDLVQRVFEAHRQEPGVPGLDLMMEIEQRASKRTWLGA